MPSPTPIPDRVLLHPSETRRRPIDPSAVYFIDAEGGDSWIRFRGSRRLKDIRELGQLQRVFSRFAFVRVHDGYIVNARKIAELRKRSARDWEVKLLPPVNQVLPVSRAGLKALRAVFGD